MSLQFHSSIDNIVSINESFDKAVMRIAYCGNNQNNTWIDKATFEKCTKTLPYVPVVARYFPETKSIGSHDSAYITDENGELQEIVMTTPLGLVPENPNCRWETVREADDNVNQYLCCDILLWKRQPAYKTVKANKYTKQSMEIAVHDFEMVNDFCYIKDFTFTALCLLGNAEPCFPSAALIFNKTDFQVQYTQMYEEFKLLFSNQLSGLPEFDVHKNIKEDEHITKKFTLSSQVQSALREALEQEKLQTEDGSFPRYAMIDYDAQLKEVYCYDLSDSRLYGIKYTTSGDHIAIDFGCKTRKKFAFADFLETDTEQPIAAFALAANAPCLLKRTKELEQAFTKNVNSLAEENVKLAVEKKLFDSLLKFKEDTLAEQERQEKKSILNHEAYSVLREKEEYKNLTKNLEKYTPLNIQMFCDLMLADYVKKTNAEPLSRKIPFDNGAKAEAKPYGTLFDEQN